MSQSVCGSSADETYMRRCLELARLGAGYASPNPMVGSVIVHDGQIVGEGYHERYGGPHAEVNAIASVSDESILSASTLYVNLEPCSHYGKTPPCSDLIIDKSIPRVVIGCRDPHDKVAGRGIGKLRDAGVEVLTGVLEEESLELNAAFVKSHTEGMPLVIQKIAQTLDGRIALASGASRWITGEEARKEVHRLRSCYDAVLTSSATVIADDPQLTVRSVTGRNPLRVVLDRRLRAGAASRVFDAEAETVVYTSSCMTGTAAADRLRRSGVRVYGIAGHDDVIDPAAVLRHLHDELRVQSVMVESGGILATSLLTAGLVDRLVVFVAPKLFGGDAQGAFASLGLSVPADAPLFRFSPPRFFGDDLCLEASAVR
ncbi:bifunctional diaminohydroxyphosphoribosylaminopyrimidine deaminase/5-amino-6-(5-phosphoribosylamino)uracil reductase RibD [Prosthecochloris ethylica]|nr:bifunctional diaminohydroxyphosphoribosylaminopyrimidine deaminase/5-amino-6-(5-phosphoribosylamino)uracil reductase RibD [Prosthecochloris ethylica]